MDDALEERVGALERAVTDGEHTLTAIAAEADAHEQLAELDTQVETLSDRVVELEATTQALRGYVGNIRAVNQDIETRADVAIAKVDELEATLANERESLTQPGSEDATDQHGSEQPTPTSTESGASRNTDHTTTCHTCGRPHRAETTSTDTQTHTDPTEHSQQISETLVPETSETSTLKRLREMF